MAGGGVLAVPPGGGGEIAAAVQHALFFALQPDALAADALVRTAEWLRQDRGLHAAPIALGRLHLSLNGLHRDREPPPGELTAMAMAAAARVRHPPFKVALDRVVSWKGPADARPVVAWSPEWTIGAEGLHAALHAELVAAGLSRPRLPEFWPHVTLLRSPGEVPDVAIPPVEWSAREFVLIHSEQGAGRFRIAGCWPLAA